jgi:5'-nucleotidase (lipoprotein e(P4) family)
MMKKQFALVTVTLLLISTSCTSPGDESNNGEQDHLIMSVLWFQRSAEMRALFIQGYNIASERLTEAVAMNESDRPLAVVADIDETILDNSPFEGWQIGSGNGFSEATWKAWTDREEARPLPGALEFALHAESLGVEIFYVSNRSVDDALGSTLRNLISFGFPYADSSHVLLKSASSSKIERRNRILETHEIILLIGDNLSDLDGVFERRDRNYGFEDVDSLAGSFGKRFIMLPNPMYGSWTSPALDRNESLTMRERMVRSIVSFQE